MYAWSKHLLAFGLGFFLCSQPLFAAEDSEVKMGREAHEELLKTTHFYDDPELLEYVNSVGQKLAANSDWPDIEYHFFIVDSPGINAFALPGGYIYINRGLMSYLTSEAQLAGVLAHEIAHVTRHHAVRRRTKQRLGDAAAFIASIVTWNSNVGEAIQLENAALVSGYGREMELEADEYGAVYMYRSGYDPNAMIELMTILKEHERFTALKGRDAGRSTATYHGVFSTHPKSDTRLQEVIAQAGQLPPGEAFQGRDIYREKTRNMVYGENITQTAPPGFQRYASKGLGVTFEYPSGWQRSTQGQSIILSSPDDIQLEISVARPQPDVTDPEILLKQRFQVEELKQSEPVYEDNTRSDEAAQAIVDTENGDKRVAVIKSGSYEYYFNTLQPVPLSDEQDESVTRIIASFRRAEPRDFPPDRVYTIDYHRLKPGETFTDLAANSSLGRYSEEELRLLNGYYPSGEPQPGTWLKVVR
ncbi:MAG: M48 family metalloprotease [Porticoccaceae bacterium]